MKHEEFLILNHLRKRIEEKDNFYNVYHYFNAGLNRYLDDRSSKSYKRSLRPLLLKALLKMLSFATTMEGCVTIAQDSGSLDLSKKQLALVRSKTMRKMAEVDKDKK